MKYFKILFITVLIFLLVSGLEISSKSALASQVVVVDLGGLTYEKITELNLQNIKHTIINGASALMNTNTADARTIANGFLTLGSGRITSYAGLDGEGYSSNEIISGQKAKKVYYHRTGKYVPEGGLAVLDLPRAKNRRRNDSWGKMGEVIRQAGLKTALLGNWDIAGQPGRSAALMVMDSEGIIDIGYTDSSLIKKQDGPINISTDYSRLLQKFEKVLESANLIFIETGDLRRLEVVKEDISPQVYQKAYQRYAFLFDNFIGDLKKKLPDDAILFLLNPVPSKESQRNKELMTPIIFWQQGMKKSNVLFSNTTKREGIVSNLDIMPTILFYLGVPVPSGTVGNLLKNIQRNNPLEFFLKLNEKLIFTYKARPTLVKGYVFSQIITIILSLYLLISNSKKIRYLKPLLLGVMTGPLALLVIGVLPQNNIVLSIGAALFLITVIVVTSLSIEKIWGLSSFEIIAFFTSLILVIDVLSGANLIKNSTLGYDPIAGARYYGIGNEFMGILIGSTAILSGFVMERYKEYQNYTLISITVYFILIIFLMGSPNYGINVGGTLTATIVFGLMLLLFTGANIKMQHVGALIATSIATVVLMAIISLKGEYTATTHLGRTTQLIINGNLMEISKIILRKLAMNLKLIKYTIWSRVFLLGLVALVVIFYKPMGMVKKLKKEFPYLTISFIGILTGSLVVLLCNDSGIVAAATMMIYGVAPLIHVTGLLQKNPQI